MTCSICGRILDNVGDPLSGNCGGDCAGCMLDIEIKIGDYTTAQEILTDIENKLAQLRVKDKANGIK